MNTLNNTPPLPTTKRRILILILFAETALILGTGLEIANGIAPARAFEGLATGTVLICGFLVFLRWFLTGELRMRKAYPFLAAFVALYCLLRLVLLFVNK